MKTLRTTVILVALLSVLPAAAAPAAPTDVVLRWNEVMLTALAGQNPFASARIAAITHLAVFEAVNAITRQYESFLGTLTAPSGASVDAAAVTAGHDALVHLVPAAAAQVGAARDAALLEVPEGAAKQDGIAVGRAAAAALVALRSGDGSAPPQFFAPASQEPGQWQTTPGCPPAGGILFHWQNVAPFAIERADQFRAGPPPALSSDRYRRDYDEVKTVGGLTGAARSDHWSDVARFYNTVLAVAVWNPVARQLSVAHGSSVSENARAFALLNVAIADALVSVIESKYHFTFWRPETAIHAGDVDGNDLTTANPGFVSFLPSPCFPSYPSAHAAGSNAARRIVEMVWGSGKHEITLSHPAVPGVELTYTSLRQITDDIDGARIYGGIHFRFDQSAGGRQGRRIASYVYRTALRPRPGTRQ